ncbi:MAG: hypothetical protein EZS28_032499 [Streblomastix strix]|uniref:Uncharacterized protein n=1 Tax=Streblomastix strix TaxID=222440 RepID=A0A5J4UP85_9EUKA|nr:MAG: hypothetical protein EZS28_032499 [Streblomastix strix]
MSGVKLIRIFDLYFLSHYAILPIIASFNRIEAREDKGSSFLLEEAEAAREIHFREYWDIVQILKKYKGQTLFDGCQRHLKGFGEDNWGKSELKWHVDLDK